jgi:hypothetical protein
MPLETELVVIGEESGRWKTNFADATERQDAPAVLQQIAAPEFKWTFMDFEGTSFPITVELLDDKKAYPPLAAVRKRRWLDRRMPPTFIKLTTRILYSDEDIRRFIKPGSPDTPEMSQTDAERAIAEMSVREFAGVLPELLLGVNIARPGSLHCAATYQFIDGEFFANGRACTSGLNLIVSDALKRGWPQFEQIEVQTVMNWLEKVPGLRDRHAENRLSRALAAASNLFKDGWGDSNELELVWALLGLEALYARGNQGLQEQLSSKTEAYLGPRATQKKDFANMYNFRSRFLHGDIDFPYAYSEANATPQAEKYLDDRIESETVAAGLLYATLQRMCIEGRLSLDFHYAVSPP